MTAAKNASSLPPPDWEGTIAQSRGMSPANTTTRLENPMHRAHRRLVIEDELQNRCTDDAVERVIGDGSAYRQIVDYRVGRFSAFDIDDFGARNPIATELERVPVVIDFQHGSTNACLVSREKLLDVIAVDRLPAVQPPRRAPRPHPSQDIEIRDPIHR